MSILIDSTVMSEIASLDDGALMNELVAIHRRDALIALRAMEQNDEIRRWAHKLKGSSATLGLCALADACQSLEDACKAGRDLGPFVHAVRRTYEATELELKTL